ncbi:MAG: hypothetical protein ACQEQF_05915 [Bacillota bacterium]
MAKLKLVPTGKIIIELSFKGPNKDIANDYAVSNKNILKLQKQAFFILKNYFQNKIWETTNRLFFYIVGGLGPSLIDPSIIPVDVYNDNYPLFHKKTWDESFRKVVENFKATLIKNKGIYKSYLREHSVSNDSIKIPLDCMWFHSFQRGWVSNPENVRKFVEKYLRIRNENKNNKLDLDQYDIKEANNKIVSKIEEMNNYFYQVYPQNHYSYL